jgi:hypothetical protein
MPKALDQRALGLFMPICLHEDDGLPNVLANKAMPDCCPSAFCDDCLIGRLELFEVVGVTLTCYPECKLPCVPIHFKALNALDESRARHQEELLELSDCYLK